MGQNIFKIKRSFLIPFNIIIILLFLLLLLSLFKGQTWERIVLAVSFIGTFIVGMEAARREIIVAEDGLKIKKFFRLKELVWAEITHLAVVNMAKKAYFLLTTTKGFYFFSNMFENHSLLIRSIVDKLENEKVEVEVRDYLEHPVERVSMIVICWLAVFIITAFVVLKFL